MKNKMDDLAELYRQKLSLPNSQFTRIDHDQTMVATVFKITQKGSADLILKICSREGDFFKESYFLNRFAEKLPVPKILRLIEPEENLDAAILMEFVPGNLLTPTTTTKSLAHQTGLLLARIHLEKAGGYGDLTVPDQLSQDPRIPFTMKFNEGLDECKGHLSERLLETCRYHFKKDIDLLISTDGPCVIHRDFRPGNLIVADRNVRGIIDWASARGGFAEEDICRLEFGEWPEESKISFIEGYASVRKVPDYEPLLPLIRLTKAVGVVGFTIKRGTWSDRDSRFYLKNLHYLESLELL